MQMLQSVRSGRSDHSVPKWNARVLRTGSGQNVHARGSEPLSSPAPVGQSAGIWRVAAGQMYARALDFSTKNWPQAVLFGQPEPTDGKRPKFQSNVIIKGHFFSGISLASSSSKCLRWLFLTAIKLNCRYLSCYRSSLFVFPGQNKRSMDSFLKRLTFWWIRILSFKIFQLRK